MTEANRPEELSVVKPFGASKPAHPAVEIRYSTGPGPVATTKVFHTGLTKRELFAAMAMQGLLSNWEALARMGFKAFEVEMFAVERADALLKELAK